MYGCIRRRPDAARRTVFGKKCLRWLLRVRAFKYGSHNDLSLSESEVQQRERERERERDRGTANEGGRATARIVGVRVVWVDGGKDGPTSGQRERVQREQKQLRMITELV
jgi:hypothetical protein